MKRNLSERNIPRENIKILGTWAPDKWQEFQPAPDKSRSKFGLNDQFTIIYPSFAGDWYNFELICEALSLPEKTIKINGSFLAPDPVSMK